MEHFRNTSLENIVEEIDGIVYVEEWRPIKGFEGVYEISSFGRVKRLARTLKGGEGRPPMIRLAGGGKKKQYLKVNLSHNGKKLGESVHRLVAQHFIPPVEGKPHINHIHGRKRHNHYSKLEWCTPQENNEHGVKMGLLKRGVNKKPYIKKGRAHVPVRYKKIIDTATGKIYNSSKELSESTGLPIKTIRRTLSGERYNHTTYRYVGQEDVFLAPPPKKETPIAVFDMNWNLKEEFHFIESACEFVSCTRQDINDFVNGRRSMVKGYKFKLIDNDGNHIEPIPFVSTKPPLKPKRIPQPTTPSKEIIKFDVNGNELQRFSSVGEATIHVGSDKGNFRKVLKGKVKGRPGYYKGFIYRYA